MGRDAEPATAAELPELPLKNWQATYDTLHMWTQIVGKGRKILGPEAVVGKEQCSTPTLHLSRLTSLNTKCNRRLRSIILNCKSSY